MRMISIVFAVLSTACPAPQPPKEVPREAIVSLLSEDEVVRVRNLYAAMFEKNDAIENRKKHNHRVTQKMHHRQKCNSHHRLGNHGLNRRGTRNK